MHLAHIASRLYGAPLLLAPSKLDIILSVLGNRVGWPSPAEMALPPSRASPSSTNATEAWPSTAGSVNDSGIAVIPIHGSLVRRAIGVEAMSGLTSYADIAARLDAAVKDPEVQAILLDIDSPGGEAGGVFELAAQVRAATATKPVWALACDSAFSAAYAIACAADRVFVTQTAGVGSIGVIAMHVDQSVRDAQEGYRFTPVSAGEFKNDLSAHAPASKDALERLQAEVDRLYGLFVDHVAAMRGMDARAVRKTEAALFFGPDAVNAGLADAMASSEQVFAELAALVGQRQRPGGLLLQATASSSVPTTPTLMSSIPMPINPISSNLEELPMSPETKSPETEQVPQDDATSAIAQVTEALQPQATQPISAQAAVSVVAPVASLTTPQPPLPPSADALTQAGISAAQAAQVEALAIAELCQLAGQSDRTVSFLSQRMSAAQVRQALLASRAQSEEITSHIHPDAAVPASVPTAHNNALMAAVKRLHQTA
jgi:signal peptide peptidase SppA